jgi:chemotaxis-related protein WspB
VLFLLFQLGNDRYALQASRVVEVMPFVNLSRIPNAPRGVSGMFNYRGKPVPAIDLCELTQGKPAENRLSTRIILVNYPDEQGRTHLLGLIAARVTATIRRASSDFVDPGFKLGNAPYLGPVMMDSEGCVQWVYEQRLLTDPVRDLLFCETLEQS